MTEAVEKNGDREILEKLKQHARDAETTLLRMACKMATGSGKTAVMGMVIAWHLLNLGANPGERRFSDSFLVVAPGITIRDRLRVLLPSDPENCYRQLDLSRSEQEEREGCRDDLEGFIRRAPAQGYDEIASKSFRNRKMRGGVRMDVEINKGKAFIDDPRPSSIGGF